MYNKTVHLDFEPRSCEGDHEAQDPILSSGTTNQVLCGPVQSKNPPALYFVNFQSLQKHIAATGIFVEDLKWVSVNPQHT